VLDFGFVQYVSHMGSDLTVASAARVSFSKESVWDEGEVLSDKDKKLVSYLAKHNHWTPFAHPQITLRVKAPISIRTQLFKHKVGFVENEISRRYVSDPPEFYHPRWRSKPANAKQGSEEFLPVGAESVIHDEQYKASTILAFDTYRDLINSGIAPEQARFVLPQGAYTEWCWTGSLSAYARVCNLRSDTHAQWEVREYAAAISKIIGGHFPYCWSVLVPSQ